MLGLLLAAVVHRVLADAAGQALLGEAAQGLVAHVAGRRPREARRVEVVRPVLLLVLQRSIPTGERREVTVSRELSKNIKKGIKRITPGYSETPILKLNNNNNKIFLFFIIKYLFSV